MENKELQTPFELFGIECGDGWKSLYQPIIDWIADYNEKNKDVPDFVPIQIFQIKEKFGQLRIYVSYEPEELSEMIGKAESESEKTCEHCGSKNDVGTTIGWISHFCRNCMERLSKSYPTKEYRWRNEEGKIFKFLDGKVEISD